MSVASAIVGAAGVLACALLLARWPSQRVDTITRLVGKREQHPYSAFSDESVRRAVAFVPRPTDVFVLTAPKTGTTWLQQICHQIRTRASAASMDFEDIYQVAPWQQMSWDLDIDVNDEQPASPRIYKTHQRLSSINRGGKYIVTVRDPERAVISWYKFLTAKGVPPVLRHANVSEFAFDKDFVVDTWRFGANLWEYYVEFWKCRHEPNVLLLVYEDMLSDLPSLIRRIARFMEVDALDYETVERIAAHISKKFMMEHASKFDESWAYVKMQQVGRIKEFATFKPVSRVTAGHSDKLDDRARAFFDKQWKEYLHEQTGCSSYAEMAEKLRRGV